MPMSKREERRQASLNKIAGKNVLGILDAGKEMAREAAAKAKAAAKKPSAWLDDEFAKLDREAGRAENAFKTVGGEAQKMANEAARQTEYATRKISGMVNTGRAAAGMAAMTAKATVDHVSAELNKEAEKAVNTVKGNVQKMAAEAARQTEYATRKISGMVNTGRAAAGRAAMTAMATAGDVSAVLNQETRGVAAEVKKQKKSVVGKIKAAMAKVKSKIKSLGPKRKKYKLADTGPKKGGFVARLLKRNKVGPAPTVPTR